jgi:hypothetical protein
MRGSETSGEADRVSTQLAVQLRELLDGLPVGAHFEVHPGADICFSLELFLPRALREQHTEWEKESLDGIFVARATKTGPTAAKLVCIAILISDQTVTPFVVELAAPEVRGVAVRHLSIGEAGAGPLGIAGPAANSKDAQRLLATLLGRIHEVAWSYTLETES